MNQEVDRLYETIIRLRELLTPFARQAEIVDQNAAADGDKPLPDCWHFRLLGSYSAITVGDCRRANEELQHGR